MRNNYIIKIICKYKVSIFLIYIYIFFSQSLFLLDPYILGKAIDGLINKEYFWIIIFLSVEIIANIIFYKRMVFDTKVYTKMYNELIFEYLSKNNDTTDTKKIARVDLANNIINFLESDLTYYMTAIITIVGSLSFIFLTHFYTGLVVMFVAIPILFIVLIFYSRINQITKVFNSHFEQKMSAITSKDDKKIETFFKRRGKLIILQSTLQAKNWISLNVVKILFLIFALIIFTNDTMCLTQGEAITMYVYINQFLTALLAIPYGIETYTRIKDTLNRIKIE